MSSDPQGFTELLQAHARGDASALDRLFPKVYDELRQMARGRLRNERPDHTLSATELVHEAFFRLVRLDRLDWKSRAHFLAIARALAAPKRVSHLVLVNTARTGPDVTGFVEMENAVATLPDPVPEAFVREFQVSTVHAPVGDAFIDRAVAESLRLPARVWRELAAGMRATPRAVALGRSGIPTLVLRGEQDAYVSAAENDSLIAMVRASVFKVYPNTGHALHWEQPATFAKDVLAFRGTTR
jgi:non-heme chloroperoxidase